LAAVLLASPIAVATASTAATTTVPVAGAASGSGVGDGGLAPAPPGLSARLELRSRFARAGRTLHGDLVVTNRTGSPVDLTALSPHGCRPQFAVALVNAKVHPIVAFPTLCDARPLVLAPGATRLPFDVLASSDDCGRRPSPCSVPAGKYRAELFADGQLALPAPKPVTVTVRG
jgi:hypothetical protein